MPGSIIPEETFPIPIKQAVLHKYFDDLPFPNEKSTFLDLSTNEQKQDGKPTYHYTLEPENRIEIEESHCLRCHSRLVRNGFNDRKIIFEKGFGTRYFKIHRKRCNNCGEIIVDLSSIVPKFANYHVNFRRRSRQLYMKGHIPSKIQDSFSLIMDQWVPKSTLVTWIRKVETPLHNFLVNTPVPSSGYWGYDEIHLRMCKKKRYAFTMVDTITKFAICVGHYKTLERTNGKHFLRSCKRNKSMPIKVLNKDGGMVFGNIFKKRGYNKIKVQLCCTHNKWLANRYIRQYCGMAIQSKKSLPPKGIAIQKLFYRCIDASTVTERFVAIEALKSSAFRIENKFITRGSIKVIRSLPNQHHWHADPNIDRTNNISENFNQYLQKYPTYKRKMKTMVGAQRVSDFLCFWRNLGLFLNAKVRNMQKFQQWKSFCKTEPTGSYLKRQGRYYQTKRKKLDMQFRAYLGVWKEFFEIIQ